MRGTKIGNLSLNQFLRQCHDIQTIDDKTLETGRRITQEAGTGWDFYVLHREFCEALAEGFRPNNVNGAFIGFIKKKVVKAP